MYVCKYVNMCVTCSTCVYSCMYVCTVCIYVCMCIDIYVHAVGGFVVLDCEDTWIVMCCVVQSIGRPRCDELDDQGDRAAAVEVPS